MAQSKVPDWMDAEPLDGCDVDVIIVDIGYVKDEAARNRADEIFALGVGKKNLIRGPSTAGGRIHMHIPKTKKKKVFSALPISDKKTWFGATHSYHAVPANANISSARFLAASSFT